MRDDITQATSDNPGLPTPISYMGFAKTGPEGKYNFNTQPPFFNAFHHTICIYFLWEVFNMINSVVLLHPKIWKIIISVARTVIPRHWKSTSITSLSDRAMEVDHIRELEGLLAQEKDKEEQFSLAWTSWSMFRYFTEFVTWAEGKIDASTPYFLIQPKGFAKPFYVFRESAE